MKRTLLFTVLIFSIATAFAQPKLTSILHQFKSIHTGWQSANEDTFSYDNRGLLKTVGFNLFFLTTKTHGSIDSNYYSSSGQLDSTKSFRWSRDSNTWQPAYERLIKFEYNGARLKKIIRLTEGINSKFAEVDSFIYNSVGKAEYHYSFSKERATGLNSQSTRLISKYNTLGKIEEQTRQYPKGGVWTSTGRVIYKYNSSDSLIEKLQQGFQGGVWINGFRTTYTYNSNGELIEEFDERYNSAKTSWENRDKLENSYVAGKKQYTLRKTYFNGSWITTDSSAFVYNPDGTLKIFYPPYQGTELRTLYFYKTFSTSLDKVNETKPIKIYPNPTNGKFTIELGNTEPSAITITDITGKQVYTTKSSGDLDIDLTNLQKGIYLVNINSGAKSSTQKIAVQ